MKLLVVLGEGGHTMELLHLIGLMGDCYEYHYVITKEDRLSAQKIKYSGEIYRLGRPRGKHTSQIRAILQTIWATVQAAFILLSVRPTAILSTGPAVTIPVSVIGKLFGAKIIFVETGSRVQSLSMTGRIMYRWADLFFVQWPQLQAKLPKSIFAGRLI